MIARVSVMVPTLLHTTCPEKPHPYDKWKFFTDPSQSRDPVVTGTPYGDDS
jgi:hypothetical protein